MAAGDTITLALSMCFISAAAAAVIVTASASVPAKPTPYFSWDKIPVAYHGANKARMYTQQEVEQLAERYQMVTLEKWYTPCGSQGPQQTGPECNVEAKMATTFKAIKAANSNVTTLLYLNSMFNFNFYHLSGLMLEREAKGLTSLLRDKYGKLVSLCNDGNVYCNITSYDLSVKEVRDLWLETAVNMTRDGGVDGVFADHGYEQGVEPSRHDLLPPEDPQLCNGKGDARQCYHFEPDFAKMFNAGHEFILTNTQDVLANLTGGPVIDGPYGSWNRPACNLNVMQEAVEMGRNGTGPFVLEFNRINDTMTGCNPDESCLAAFLIAADQYSYMSCFHSQGTADEGLPKFIPAFQKPLGEPTGPAVQEPRHVWKRSFVSHAGETVVQYNQRTKSGTIEWAVDAA